MTVHLFKIITSRDEIIIGLSAAELAILGGSDAHTIGRKLASDGALGVWQYAVRRAPEGQLEQAPLRHISLLANAALRIEPYDSPLPVVEA